jgi:hypothetical protein
MACSPNLIVAQKNYPGNISTMPAVKFSSRLDFERKFSFFNGNSHFSRLPVVNDDDRLRGDYPPKQPAVQGLFQSCLARAASSSQPKTPLVENPASYW